VIEMIHFRELKLEGDGVDFSDSAGSFSFTRGFYCRKRGEAILPAQKNKSPFFHAEHDKNASTPGRCAFAVGQ
jgi:hypothetical protein